MLPGPDVLYMCPNCNNFIYNESLMSGNTCGASLFSDGKLVAPMLPEFPNLTKCKKCSSFLWLGKMKSLGYFNMYNSRELAELTGDPNVKPDKAEFLSLDDLFGVLNLHDFQDPREEIFVRTRIWWTFNDRIRYGKGVLFQNDDDEFRYLDNIASLINLNAKSSPDELFSLAENYRNLGDFNKCIEIINSIVDPELIAFKLAFLLECENKNRWVVRLR